MRVACFSDVGDQSVLMDIFDIMDSYMFSMDDLQKIAAHVQANYPGTSLRTFLSDVGFDMTNVPQDALIAVGSVNIYNIEYFVVDSGVAARCYCNFPSISIDDSNVKTEDRDCYKAVTMPGGGQYAEVLSDGYVINFNEA